jgi:hypothetical protein
MLVYSNHPSPRFEYIARYILETLCGIEIFFVYDEDELTHYDGPSICYYPESLHHSSFHISPYGLLSEKGIREQEINMEGWRGSKIFFLTNGSDLPFDIFSASFFLLSRYEEYLPYEKDIYGRYGHDNSAASNYGFLQLPLINIWAIELRRLLLRNFPRLIYTRRQFSFVPTYDIDMAWTYLHKGILRNAGGLARSVVRGEWKQSIKRINVLRGKRPDPFDVYEWLDALHLKYSLRPYYFFLLAGKQKEFDRNIDPRKKAMKNLISYHALGYHVGIHPSWQSGDIPELLEKEISDLKRLTGQMVTASRFHYIRFGLPDDYRNLISLGIRDDYSMGYGDINGFRASVSTPYPWYDLLHEEEKSLIIHPFCWMDANSHYEQGYTPSQAFLELKSYHESVKRAEGELNIILHNSFFSDEPEFAGWKQVYEIFLDEVVYWDL